MGDKLVRIAAAAKAVLLTDIALTLIGGLVLVVLTTY